MTPIDEPVLSMREVTKTFGAVRALDNVNLDVWPGEVHALIGENGAGKSTLMKVLSGAERPDAGTMTLAGRPFMPSGPRNARKSGIAMIYQELTIAPHLSVEANVMLGLERSNAGLIRRGEHQRLVRDALALLGHAEISPETRAGALPLAALQIVEIARALVSNARVVVFDEPTSVLTEADVNRLFAVIERLRHEGLAIVYISHFLEELERVANRYTVLRDGRTVATGLMASINSEKLVAEMIGRPLAEMFPRVDHECGSPILELTALRGQRLPTHVDLTLRRGEILGIAGLVGAGRSELLRAIFGLEPVKSGRIRIATWPDRPASPHTRIQQGMGFLSEDRKDEGLSLTQSIEDNITLSVLNKYGRFGWLSLRRKRAAAVNWMKALRVASVAPAQSAGSLSGGNQQKVAIGRLLNQDADVLLLDEPTRGIDVGSKVDVYQLIGELAARGKAIIMVSSYLPELLGVCDRVGVMRRGVLSEIRQVDEWTEHELLALATGA
jgi:ribose transport system ATP-binding protein